MNRILVAEDDPSIKSELILLLQNNGYQPVDELPAIWPSWTSICRR